MNQETKANTSWANEAIAMHFAEDNIGHKYLGMFYFFVRRSFGYSKRYTDRITTKEISKLTGLSEPTVISYIKYLSENNFIKVNKSTRFIKDGGSEANSYSPCYPKGYEMIKFKDDEPKTTQSAQQHTTTSGSESIEHKSYSYGVDF